jgi:hypothetical protein
MRTSSNDDQTTRVSLTRRELLHLHDFAENVDDIDNAAFWDALTTKLDRAIARIDGADKPAPRHTRIVETKPDQRPAECRECGWKGTLTKTAPCPTCGVKCNPFLFYGSRR